MTGERTVVSIVYALCAASACAFFLRVTIRALMARCALSASQCCMLYGASIGAIPLFMTITIARLWRGAEVSGMSLPIAAATGRALPVLMRAASMTTRIAGLLILIWVCGAAFGLIRTLIRYRAARSLLASALPCDDVSLIDTANAAAAAMNVACPRVLMTAKIATPAVAGGFHPVLLMPDNIGSFITEAQTRLVIAHELAHIARYDTVINLGQTVVENIFFFCPSTRALSSELRAEREIACDAMATEAMAPTTSNAPLVLARALERLRDHALLASSRPRACRRRRAAASSYRRARHD